MKRHLETIESVKCDEVTNYFGSVSFDWNDKSIAANENTFAYRICKHGQNFRFMDCTSVWLYTCSENVRKNIFILPN